MKKSLHQILILSGLTLLSLPARAGNPGIAYPDPPGGWMYILNGDQAVCGAGNFDSLDGTWNRSNGSSEWDCSAPGGTIMSGNFPGGVAAVTNGAHASETGISYLRIQDPGNPSQFSAATNNGCGGCTIANPANRKILFVHNMTAEGCPDTVLDDGFTITFRARIPTAAKTTAPIDSLYPSGEAASGPQPYPTDGDGILIQDNANGCLSARQLGGGKIGFSLVTSNDCLTGTLSNPKANFRGLQVNGLNGTVNNNTIDFNEVPAQFLPLDTTDWNEFWIVVKKDDSGLGTHTLFVYTNGSLSAQIFHVTAASSAGEQSGNGHIEMGSSQTAQNGAVDIDFMAYRFDATFPPGSGGLPPSISAVTPTPPPQGNLFWPNTNGVAFTASVAAPKNIPTSGILLLLNGSNVSSGLVIGSDPTNRTVTFNGLAPNTVYSGRILVTDSGGQSASFPLLFDTFSETTTVLIEAEDYNHDSGQFVNNPAPNSYGATPGTAEVDFHDVTGLTAGAYRTADAVDTLLSGDTARDQFVNASASDYDVGGLEQREWLNYTRTFAGGGKYNVYLRYVSTVAQSVRLDLVASDRAQSNQVTSALGSFALTNSGAARTYARLGDGFGNPLVVNLSGDQTVRLTAPDASLNAQLNYLVFAPLTSAVTNPPVIGSASPASNSTTHLPDAPIRIGIVNRDTSVVLGSINFRFDGVDVTGSSSISNTATGAAITYQPPAQLALNSTHTNRVVFTNDASPARSFTNQWAFTVANLPVLSSAWASAPGSGSSNGFNGLIHWHNGGQDLIFVNNNTRGENQLDGTLKDVDTGLPYTNEAPGPNSDGTFTETGVINYDNDNTDRDIFAGDLLFPNITTPGTQKHVAMSVTAYVELSAGLQRFGVRRNDGFRLASGPDFTRAGATLTLGLFETANNDFGSAATEFDFVVPVAGLYPMRLVFFQNSGPSDLEWFSVNRATGATTLINAASGGAVKAYMARTVAPVTGFSLLNPKVSGGTFSFSYDTVIGHQYFVEYKNSPSDATWQALPAVDGDGTTKTFSVAISVAANRIYRVRAQ